MSAEEKAQYIQWIDNACRQGARQSKACKVVGIHAKTLQRWKQADCLKDKRTVRKHQPSNQLCEFERAQIVYGHGYIQS